MPWTSVEIMTVLWIVVAVMIIIVLYHVLFIVVDLRRTLKRVDRVTGSVESVMLKPLAVADEAMEWVVHQIAAHKHAKHEHHHKKDA